TSREGFARTHLGDRTDIDIVGEQNELVDALAALGKPMIVCALNGRPPSWPNVVDKASAVLECWYPGQEGGVAMAEALLGRINPGAKLPVTVVRNSGQVPLFHDRKPSSRRGYLVEDAAPLFPFGHGLSYTSFEISEPRVSAASVSPGQLVEVTVEVANTGSRAGDEVVQLYIGLPERSVTQPTISLKGFERVTLAPGERKTVSFTLEDRHLAIWNRDMLEVVEPGPVVVSVGNSSVALKQAEFTIA